MMFLEAMKCGLMLIERKVWLYLTVDGRGNLLTLSFQLASCDKCNFNSAFFYQLQIRSADEPMTTCAISIISDFLILLTAVNVKFIGDSLLLLPYLRVY